VSPAPPAGPPPWAQFGTHRKFGNQLVQIESMTERLRAGERVVWMDDATHGTELVLEGGRIVGRQLRVNNGALCSMDVSTGNWKKLT
jgi:hypothetical protein